MGFGDVSQETDDIDDRIVSNNNDRDVVLATIAATVLDFTNIHGNHYILVVGSTAARTRLYQMSIAGFWDEISLEFDVFGFRNEIWSAFERNINYEAFLVKRK